MKKIKICKHCRVTENEIRRVKRKTGERVVCLDRGTEKGFHEYTYRGLMDLETFLRKTGLKLDDNMMSYKNDYYYIDFGVVKHADEEGELHILYNELIAMYGY